MRVARLTLSNFRCFGPEAVSVELNDLTALIGANGSGKTAVLEALSRLFGSTQASRTLVPEDFHVPPGERREDAPERHLEIEARLEFPELDDDGVPAAVPGLFRHMTVREPGGAPYCRLRLSGTWTDTDSPGGDVEPRYHWIVSPEGEQPERLEPALPKDRSVVQVFYVPASRDTARQLANMSGTLLNRLLKAISWDEAMRSSVEDAVGALRTLFDDVEGVQRINRGNLENWRALHDDAVHSTPMLHFVAGRLDDVLRNTRIVFTPTRGDDGEEGGHEVGRLSDGERSLFYFAFINTLFGIEREIFDAHHAGDDETDADAGAGGADVAGGNGEAGAEASAAVKAPKGAQGNLSSRLTAHISYDRLQPAPLTIFALEEPENHLGPHVLGRVVQQVTEIARSPGAQVVLTSHSTAVVRRLDPTDLRYVRCTRQTGRSDVRAITLPADGTEAAKYVREAVRAHPELYFARLVVLCEGDSEAVLLPKFASAAGAPLDLALVSVVPLGGRHVNHLWRLLGDLEIPHVTLLDLDRERETGGWRTIRYVVRQLREITRGTADVRLRTVNESDTAEELTAAAFEARLLDFDKRGDDDPRLVWWITHLREFGVYFSEPLDLDFLMLCAYPAEYQELAEHGPRGMDSEAAVRAARIEKAVHAVLGADADGATYSAGERELFPWYSLLFYGHGKPSTHTSAWVRLDPHARTVGMPEPIRALLDAIRSRLAPGDVGARAHDNAQSVHSAGSDIAGNRAAPSPVGDVAVGTA